MNVLLTGPFGTIGGRVLAQLVAGGHEVTGFDLDTPANRAKAAQLPASVRVVFGDITRAEQVMEAARGQDAVVHLAALIPPFSEASPELAERVNVGGTRNVLGAMRSAAPNARLLFASSISVHGHSAGRTPPCRVDTPYDGRDHYARHKIACEQLVRASTVPWVILRIGACANPEDLHKGGSPKTAMSAAFAVAPDTRIEFLHPEDAALAFANACTSPDVLNRVLFLGSGPGSRITWREMTSTVPIALGLGPFPSEWYGGEPYYTDWMDTEESERLLRYQRRGYQAYAEAMTHNLRWGRRLLTPFRPLVRALLGRAVVATRRASSAV